MKNKITSWLISLATKLNNGRFIFIPTRPQQSLQEMDLSKCECGHSMNDHVKDGTSHICLSCLSLTYHKPAPKNILDADCLEYEEI